MFPRKRGVTPTASRQDFIVAVTAANGISTATSEDEVVTAETHDDIVAIDALEHVIPFGADDRREFPET